MTAVIGGASHTARKCLRARRLRRSSMANVRSSTLVGAHRLPDLRQPVGRRALALFVLLFDGATLGRIGVEFRRTLCRRVPDSIFSRTDSKVGTPALSYPGSGSEASGVVGSSGMLPRYCGRRSK
jgi:hypothetical protein